MSNFSIEKKGYNVSEVDEYVDDLEAKITHLQSRNAELEQKLAKITKFVAVGFFVIALGVSVAFMFMY